MHQKTISVACYICTNFRNNNNLLIYFPSLKSDKYTHHDTTFVNIKKLVPSFEGFLKWLALLVSSFPANEKDSKRFIALPV